MSNSSKVERKLAAIMFTDIVGYTELTSTDEEKALSHVWPESPMVATSSHSADGNTTFSIDREFSDKRKALVNLVGHCLFLQPVCWAIFLFSWGFVEFSWRVMEVSAEPEGLPFVYMQKSLLIALCIFMALQSFSEILKNILRIKNG